MREFERGKYLVVVYREHKEDGFVITAFLTRRIRSLERREQLWTEAFLQLIPAVIQAPGGYLWTSCDSGADTLYVNFKKPSRATDSEMTDDGVIVRFEDDEIIGLTVLRASER